MELHRQILIGDVLEKILEIPNDSIDLMITSPPYLWLRDYGYEGQWGLEDNIEDYMMKMLLLMNQVKRVIKPTGSAVVNIGDVYGGGIVHSDWTPGANATGHYAYSEKRREGMQFKRSIKKPHPNSLLFIPWEFGRRCVFELDLVCHNIIPWIKPGSMPFSGKNRFTNKWEPILWFTKEPSGYYFDLDSIRLRPKAWDEKPPKFKDREGQQDLFGEEVSEIEYESKMLDVPGQTPFGIHRNRADGKPDFEGQWLKQDHILTASGKPDPTKKGFNKRWKDRKRAKGDTLGSLQTITKRVMHNYDMVTHEYAGHPKGKNPGDIFVQTSKPYPEAHYATFPVELPEYFIQCMCPADGIVLDPFAGSGTTAEAAERLARKWILIEGQSQNQKLIRKRLEPHRSGKMTEYD